MALTDDHELERLILPHAPRLRAVLEAARQQIREGEGLRHEDFWREVDEEKLRKRGGIKRKAP
jgi:hypothetical protein